MKTDFQYSTDFYGISRTERNVSYYAKHLGLSPSEYRQSLQPR